MPTENLRRAKATKNDEFYTRFHDIEIELNAYIEYNPDVFRAKTVLLPCDDPEWSNFTRFFEAKFDELGLKRLISTSYAPDSKSMVMGGIFSEWERTSPRFDEQKSRICGRVLIMERNEAGQSYHREWTYLEGDGDFRSSEVTRYRDEADIIVTNPPFSLFREFLAWIMESNKQFLLISSKNCITYKEVFPYIMHNKMWIGKTPMGIDLLFDIPKELERVFLSTEKEGSKYKIVDGKVLGRSPCVWFTNIDHGRRHEPLVLMTMEENCRFSKHKELRDIGYRHYDNYDAIEVPYTDAIPSDYEGVMGVPISWLDKYNPEQFEIVGITERGNAYGYRTKVYTRRDSPKYSDWNCRATLNIDGTIRPMYARILIRKRV
jgi:hypothetical protein